MCGICGFSGEKDEWTLRSMLRAIEHRGPDAEGVYIDEFVSLGNRRLSIIDLEDGDQPIFNESGDVVVVYNGEIYNFLDLRAELQEKGHRFRTRTDTEVLVHLYEEYGDELATHLNGMFSFALWDRSRQRLLVVRDQVGVKPLCYWWNGRTLVFGSEIKAILKHPLVTAERDPDATHLLLNLRFIPAPRTLFKGVKKLPPGHLMVLENGDLHVRRYWDWNRDIDEMASPQEWSARFEASMRSAVGRQMVSDVPVGAFLSGGLDSSAIVAYASQHSSEPMHTFSLGFGEPTDELRDARIIANQFETRHVEETLGLNPLADFPLMIHHVEEPKVNALQGFCVARMASRHVKVALSGLGGDELYAGYDIHRHLRIVEKLRAVYPAWLCNLLSGPVRASAHSGNRALGLPFENTRRGLELIAWLHNDARCYQILRNAWDHEDEAFQRVYNPLFARQVRIRTEDVLGPLFAGPSGLVDGALWAEFNLKMVDDLLHNEDRVSMAHSLEVRVPFLDREVIQQALRIPLRHKFPGRRCKAIMKDALRATLPEKIIAKKKWGFSFNPYCQFKKDLRDVARQVLLLNDSSTREIFDRKFIQGILDHRPTPKLRWHYFMLWTALGLHYWHEVFVEGRDPQEVAGPVADQSKPALV
ncbi:MAG: asparagine synthase (glutamine-hydrolyzing) [Candidatus Paceibacterota bacterium]